MDTAKELKQMRKAKKLSQKEFAEWLGISMHTYRNWETGRRECKTWIINLIKRVKD